MSRWLRVTDGVPSGDLRRIPTFKRCGLHRSLPRGPLLSREHHFPRAMRRHDGGVGRLHQEAVLPGWRGSPASDTSRLLRYRGLPRGEIAGSAVRGGPPLPPRRAARLRTRDTRTFDGSRVRPGRCGAVQALPSRALLSARDWRREAVPRGNLRQCHWQRDRAKHRRVLGPVLPRPLLPGRLRAADSVSPWNVWQPDGAHDGGVLGCLLSGLDR